MRNCALVSAQLTFAQNRRQAPRWLSQGEGPPPDTATRGATFPLQPPTKHQTRISLMRSHSSGHALLLLALSVVAASGCSSEVNVVPPAEAARSAIEAGLKSWAGGGKPGAIEGEKVPVHFVDSAWQAGRKLNSYSISDGESQGADRRFVVKLTLASPDATEDIPYVVVGTDPIWIYREADYQRMLNMDDNPAPTKKGRPGR